MKKVVIPGILFLLLACGGPAEEVTDTAGTADVYAPADIATDPVAILTAATEAVLAVDAVSYSISLDGFFVEGDTIEVSLVGEAVLQKGATIDEALVFADYTLTIGEETVAGTAASDGVNSYFVDYTSEEYFSGAISEGASRLVQNVPQGVIMVEYLISDQPYGAELNAAGYEVLEQEVIEDHLCHVVEVQMPPYSSTWWIDAETYLPRANMISVWGPDGSGMEYTVTLMDLDAEVHPDLSTFQLESPEGYSTQEYIGAVSVGSTAPLWTLDTPDGGSISLEDLRGKVVILDFWATWCGPCRQVMPSLQALHESHGEELVIIGVNTWEQEDPVAFMEENGFTYQIVINGDGVAQQYFVEGIPTFYVIAQDGTVAFHAVGSDPANEEALIEVLGTLLTE
ncbi:MAG: TlpA family protein disulfide reductase [Candidatus Sabulitectum sp.]|nr:TlpA family protein disulfide reductase [Candidatus Sabulitectum sp.]